MSKQQPTVRDPVCVVCREPSSSHVPTRDGPLTCQRLARNEGRYILVSNGYTLSGAMGSPPFGDDVHVDPVYRFEPYGPRVCECGATPDPSESPDTGNYVENGVAKYICLRCWERVNGGERGAVPS